MNFLLWGITFGTVGKIILGIAVLRVHMRILQEHRIDGIVLQAIKREHWITLIGLCFIVLGYLFEVFFYTDNTNLLSCSGQACAAALTAAFTNVP